MTPARAKKSINNKDFTARASNSTRLLADGCASFGQITLIKILRLIVR